MSCWAWLLPKTPLLVDGPTGEGNAEACTPCKQGQGLAARGELLAGQFQPQLLKA